MKQAQAMVEAFMKRQGYQHSMLQDPVPQERDWQKVGVERLSLVIQETGELAEAWAKRDVVAVADALGDLVYVVLGAAVTVGIDLEPVFLAIHSSNMTKDRSIDGALHPKGAKYMPPNLLPILRRQFKKSRASTFLPKEAPCGT